MTTQITKLEEVAYTYMFASEKISRRGCNRNDVPQKDD